ncbi:hypothetical protein B6259_04470 [Ruminococcaceae bacterium CPB6]|nr:hypothetical protein B6259_04470 [Ruminococcaceae bacterium CPB6]
MASRTEIKFIIKEFNSTMTAFSIISNAFPASSADKSALLFQFSAIVIDIGTKYAYHMIIFRSVLTLFNVCAIIR